MTRISRESLSEKIPRSQFFLLTVSSLYLSLSHSWLSSPLTQTLSRTSMAILYFLTTLMNSERWVTNTHTKWEQRGQIYEAASKTRVFQNGKKCMIFLYLQNTVSLTFVSTLCNATCGPRRQDYTCWVFEVWTVSLKQGHNIVVSTATANLYIIFFNLRGVNLVAVVKCHQ